MIPMTLSKWRLLTLIGGALLVVSYGLLFWASLRLERIPPGTFTWQGVVDVGVALVLAMLAITLSVKSDPLAINNAWRRSYQLAIFFTVALIVVLWLLVERIRWWDVLLLGLTWRTYLVLQSLPGVLALWQSAGQPDSRGAGATST